MGLLERLPSRISSMLSLRLFTANAMERRRMRRNAWKSSWGMSVIRHRCRSPMPSSLLILYHQVAILVDDMIDSGKTLSLAARTLHEKGAKSVHALISHGMFIPGL